MTETLEAPNKRKGLRDHSGRFLPGGQSISPGRPKVAQTFKQRCQAFMVDEGGWDRLVAIARGEVPLESQLGALKLVCEYAYGKPQQHVDLTTGGQPLIKALSPDDLELLQLPEPEA